MTENWKELMISACNGNKDAYESLLSEISQYLEKFLYRFANNIEDRKDLTQNILLSLHLSRASYDQSLEFRPWFFTLVHHRVVDYFRKNKSKLPEQLKSVKQQIDYYGILIDELSKELDEREFRILKEIFIDGNEQNIVAENLGLSLNNLRVIIHRVKTKIFYSLKN